MFSLLLEFLGQVNPDEVAPTPVPTSGFLTIDHPVVQVLLDIIRGLGVLVVALILARFVKGWTIRALTRGRVNLNVGTLVGNLAQVGVVVVGVITAMRAFGVDWAGLLTVLGALAPEVGATLFPSDLISSVVIGTHLANHGDPWWHALPFVLLTLFLLALPALMVLTLGRRAEASMPKIRDWMNTNSWIVSEVVLVFFIVIVLSG